MTYLLLAEKPSAAQNMSKALGGMSGTFEGQPFQIHALYGHMTELVNPEDMVDDEDKPVFKSWDPENMPWDVSLMNWQKQAQSSKNPKTGKTSSKQKDITAIKKEAQDADAVVIATDKDPSGEGQLIGWEVIHAIGWKGDVKRMYFLDESEKELQKGFRQIQDLPAAYQDGEYVKAMTRERWDFISMQLSRLATHAAQSQGYQTVIRQGRLKSVMTKLVADQLARVKAYVKKPYYEVKYRDDKQNTYKRTYEDGDDWRFTKKEDAEKDMKSYQDSTVTKDSETRKEKAPGKLLDLGGLASILSGKGFKSQEVLATYQKMYEAKIVSYPRTEDKFISHEQFNEMVPLIGRIADVVGADKSLLTHTQPRKTHVKDGGAHGANRPGTTVPSSLDALSQYGKSAKAIYETLAKNFLAMFGENYVYDSIKAHVTDYPAFKTTLSVPVDQGFKAIFDADAETSDKQEQQDDDDNKESKGPGSDASPFVAEGVNKKPPHPTQKWLEKQLGKYDVGTGATRVSTLGDVTSGKYALLTDAKGKLNLTQTGEVASVLLDGSHIGSPKVTEQLFQAMEQTGEFQQKPENVLKTATDVVTHDKNIFYQNAQHLKDKVGEPESGMKRKEKVSGTYAPTHQDVTFNREWGGHRFTDDEVQALLNGQEISFEGKSAKTGNTFPATGSLQEQTYKGKLFWGFKMKAAEDHTAKTAPFPSEWSGHKFTQDEEAKLRAGETVHVQATSKRTNKDFEVDVTFELRDGKNGKRWGIVPHFDEKPDPESFTRENAPFKKAFSGYTLTDDDVQRVRNGEKILVTATSRKSGKEFTCNLSLELQTFNGNKFWGLKPHFDD